MHPRTLIALTFALTACHLGERNESPATESLALDRLPTGVRLNPVGASYDVGSLPLSMFPSPDGKSLVLILSGYDQQGAQVIDRATGKVLQTLAQPAAFVGGAFSKDGRELFVSGGDRDIVYRYGWEDGQANKTWLEDSIVLAPVAPRAHGTRYPAGMAISPDGKFLYVAENLADSLAVIDVGQRKIVKRLAAGRYPYDVVVAPNGTAYVSQWGGYAVSVFTPSLDGVLVAAGQISAGRHPSALLLNKDASRLFVASGSTDRVAVIDTKKRVTLAHLFDPPPAGPGEGATPNALALSDDGTRLFVAEADANAIGVFDLTPMSSGVRSAKGDDKLVGRIPTQWFPTAVMAAGDSLFIVNGKGSGSQANPNGPQPAVARDREGAPRSRQYVFAMMHATLQMANVARANTDQLKESTARVSAANGWNNSSTGRSPYPPFEHVIYIIKENRTYDQVFGDMKQGDGDTSLVFFPRNVGPNHHALADRFGLFDRFFVNAEVSADGHNWSMAAYATDYLQKTVQANYGGRGRTYDFEGTNRDVIPDDDVAEPANGFLWNLAEKKGITFRNYGNWVVEQKEWDEKDEGPYQGNKPFLRTHTNALYPTYDLSIRDQKRADVWLSDLGEFIRRKEMPQLQLIWLPNDHTSGARAGAPTPRAHFADNDLALGRIIEGLSRSPFWEKTVVFVLEDDAQNGPDHVDSHRSPLLVISPYTKPGTIHRFANTTDVLRTIEEILGLESLSHFDYYGRPLRDIWTDKPNTKPYAALTPGVSLDEVNPGATRQSRESELLDLDEADRANEDAFNRVLWATIKGPNVPYPGPRRITALDLKR